MLIYLGQSILLVKDKNFRIATWETDGELIVVREFAIYDEISAGDCDFNRAVKIDEHGFRQVTPPVVQMFRRKDLANKEHFCNTIQFEFSEQIQIGDIHHDGRHPENEVNRLGGNEFDQFGREHGQLFRNDDPRRAFGEHRAELKRVSVEVDRSETAHDFGAIQS